MNITMRGLTSTGLEAPVSYASILHREHQERLARIAAKAAVLVPAPQPTQAPEPEPKAIPPLLVAPTYVFTEDTITDDTADLIIVGPTRLREIQDLVCKILNVRREDLLSSRRNRMSVMARQVAMYLCKLHTGTSFPEIGRRFGGRDHSTVMHACARVEKAMATPMGTAISEYCRIDASDMMRDAINLAEVTIATWPKRSVRTRYRHAARGTRQEASR